MIVINNEGCTHYYGQTTSTNRSICLAHGTYTKHQNERYKSAQSSQQLSQYFMTHLTQYSQPTPTEQPAMSD